MGKKKEQKRLEEMRLSFAREMEIERAKLKQLQIEASKIVEKKHFSTKEAIEYVSKKYRRIGLSTFNKIVDNPKSLITKRKANPNLAHYKKPPNVYLIEELDAQFGSVVSF